MKFFTREMNEFTQLMGRFPYETRDEVKEYWNQMYESEYKKNTYEIEKKLVQVFPKLKEHIDKGEKLYTKEGPTNIFLDIILNHNENYKKTWKNLFKNYESHLVEIKPYLPKGMQELCKYKLHDSRILSVNKPEKDVIYFDINITSSFCSLNAEEIRIIFEGVKIIELPENLISRWWLHQEVHLSNIGKFDYRVLLDDGEIKIVADEAKIKVL